MKDVGANQRAGDASHEGDRCGLLRCQDQRQGRRDDRGIKPGMRIPMPGTGRASG
jgi:hypothetical protein